MRISKPTHRTSKNHQGTSEWLSTWKLIIESHAEKTRAVYGLPPLPPDVKHEQQQALAECLEGAAADVVAKWHFRTGATRDVQEVQRELATRVMQLYFKRDNEHLRRVKHALRDLPREFHARITEAMQAMLRESHDLQKPRQTPLEEKIVKTIIPVESSATSPVETAQVNTAHEARRLLDALGGAVLRDELAAEHEPHCVQDKPARRSEVILRRGIRHYDVVVPRPRGLSIP